MKMNGVRVICVCLALLLAFSLIGCSTKNDTEKTSSTPTVSNENESKNESTPSEDGEEVSDNSTDIAEDEYENYDDDFFIDSSDDEYFDGVYVDELTVLNGSGPIQKDFLGLNGVYHCYPFLEITQGRSYTEKQAMHEIKGVSQMGVKMVRSYYGTKYAYDKTKSDFDWESDDMKAIYRWMKELQKADIEISLNAGWAITQFVNDDADGRGVWDFFDGVYVHGDKEQSAKNYANWMVKSLQQFRAHGCNNVTSLLLFTEPGGFNGIRWGASEPYDGRWDGMSVTEIEDPHWPTYLRLTKALDKGLKDAGIREDYLLVGPNEAHTYSSDEGTFYLPMFYNALTEAKDYLDVFSHHNYISIRDMNLDVVAENVRLYWQERVELTNELTGKPFWIDESNIRDSSNSGNTGGINPEHPWHAVQIAVMLSEAAEIGIQNTILWTLASQSWNNNSTNNDGFINGVQRHGVIPSLYLTYKPHVSYYGVSLLTKYFGHHSEVYMIEDSILHATCEKGKDGEWNILVINMDLEPTTFKMDFEKEIGKQTFYRYVYNTASQVATADLKLIGADRGIRTDDGHFSDTIPAGSFAVYTTRKPE